MKYMRRIFICFFVCLAIVTSPGITNAKNAYQNALVYVVKNFHVVEPDIVRGAQPSEEGFTELKQQFKIKTVLNLRGAKEDSAWEKEVVEGMGMEYINIPMDARKSQSVEKIKDILDIITDENKQPIFVHCYAGKDRTGLIFAAYRIKYHNWSFEDALREMLVYGYDQKKFYRLKESLIKWLEYVNSERSLVVSE